MEETSQIDGRKAFEAALHAALAEAPAAGWRDLAHTLVRGPA